MPSPKTMRPLRLPFDECVSIAQKIGFKANTVLPKFEALLAEVDLRLLRRYGAAKASFELAFKTAKELYGEAHEVTITRRGRPRRVLLANLSVR